MSLSTTSKIDFFSLINKDQVQKNEIKKQSSAPPIINSEGTGRDTRCSIYKLFTNMPEHHVPKNINYILPTYA